MWPLRFGALTLAAAIAVSIPVAPPATAGGDPPALKICTTGDYPPLTYRDPATGQYSGVDIDMATDLAAHLGRPPVFVPTSWPTLITDLTSPGTCDIAMGGITDTPERRRVADVTKPYLASGRTSRMLPSRSGRTTPPSSISSPRVTPT